MSRCGVRRKAAGCSLVLPEWHRVCGCSTLGWCTSERAQRAPCHGAVSAAKRRAAHWCSQSGTESAAAPRLDGAPVSERSELHVTVRCPPQSGGLLTGAPRVAPSLRLSTLGWCPSERRPVPLPSGFRCHVANIGIKDDTDDFVVLAADRGLPGRGGVHPVPLRRPERHPQPSDTSPTVGCRPSPSSPRTPTSPTAPVGRRRRGGAGGRRRPRCSTPTSRRACGLDRA